MKAIMTIKAVVRGPKGDTIKLADDAPGIEQPAPDVRAMRFEPEHGRLRIVDNNDGGKEICEVEGDLTRTVTWAPDEDDEDGPLVAKSSWALKMAGILKSAEIAGLYGTSALSVEFKPSQKTMIDNNPANDGKITGISLRTEGGPAVSSRTAHTSA